MIRVINKYRPSENPKIDAVTVNIMRRYSVLSNYAEIGKHGDRTECLRLYRIWLWDEIESHSSPVYREFLRMVALAKAGNVFLKCCCKPKACHGDILRSAIEWYIAKEKSPVTKTEQVRFISQRLEFK